MSLINKEISDFTVQAYTKGPSIPFQKRMCWASGLSFSSTRRTLPLFALRSWRIWQINTPDFKAAGCEVYSVSCDTHYVHKAWHDASERIKKIGYPCWQTPPTPWRRILKFTSSGRRRGAGNLYRKPRGTDRGLRGECRKCGETRMSFCASFWPASLSMNMGTRCARPSGSPGRRP